MFPPVSPNTPAAAMTLLAQKATSPFGGATAFDGDDSAIKGIALIVFGIAIFSIQDVLIRRLGATYPAFEIMFIRGLVALGPIAWFVYLAGGFGTLRVAHPFLNIARGLLGLTSYTAYYVGLQLLPLAEATALFFVAPLVVTMLSALVLGESVGVRRWGAILVGFAGILLIVRPDFKSDMTAALLPLFAALTYSGCIIITRRIGKAQTGASLAFHSMLVFVVFSGITGLVIGDGIDADLTNPGLAFLLRPWLIPAFWDCVLIAACGVIAAMGFYCLAEGYRIAPVSLVAPFEFIAMPLAMFWGFVVWFEAPSMLAVAGIALIVGSGLYVVNREALPGKKRLTTGRRIRLRL